MTALDPATHLDPEVLAGYIARTLTDREEADVEEHLADCESCAAAARRLLTLTSVASDWKRYAGAYDQLTVIRILERAEAAVEDLRWKQRLGRWRKEWRGAAEAAVGVVMRLPGGASRMVTEGLETLIRPDATWHFTPLSGGGLMRGAGGDTALEQEPAALVALSAEFGRAEIRVEENRGAVVVVVEDWRRARGPGLVLLTDWEDVLVVEELVSGQEAASFIAEFKAVDPGDYTVLWEPRRD